MLLCQFFVLAGNRFWFYILMYLEYNTVVVLCCFLVLTGNSFLCYVSTQCTIQLCGCVSFLVMAGNSSLQSEGTATRDQVTLRRLCYASVTKAEVKVTSFEKLELLSATLHICKSMRLKSDLQSEDRGACQHRDPCSSDLDPDLSYFNLHPDPSSFNLDPDLSCFNLDHQIISPKYHEIPL